MQNAELDNIKQPLTLGEVARFSATERDFEEIDVARFSATERDFEEIDVARFSATERGRQR